MSATDVERIRALLTRTRLPVDPPPELSRQQFLDLMAVDKKALDGGLRLILMDAIGKARISDDYDVALLHATLDSGLSLTGS